MEKPKLPSLNLKASLIAPLAALTLIGAEYVNVNDNPGQHYHYASRKPIGHYSDGNLSILFDNIEDETSFSRVVKKINPDLFLATEVDGYSAKKLHNRLHHYSADWDQADRINNYFNGGFGNAIFSRILTSHYRHEEVEGDTSLINNMYKVIFKGISPSESRQEDRDIQYLQIGVRLGDKITKLQVMNTHIAGNSDVHRGQLKSVMQDIKDMTINRYPAIVCGDFNDKNTSTMKSKFSYIGYSLMVKMGDPEHIIDNGDYCAFHAGNSSSTYDLNVVSTVGGKRLHEEHYPLLARIKIK